MVHVHTVEGSDETDSGDIGGGSGDDDLKLVTAAGEKPARCTCNLSPETQDLLRQVFKDIVSVNSTLKRRLGGDHNVICSFYTTCFAHFLIIFHVLF